MFLDILLQYILCKQNPKDHQHVTTRLADPTVSTIYIILVDHRQRNEITESYNKIALEGRNISFVKWFFFVIRVQPLLKRGL